MAESLSLSLQAFPRIDKEKQSLQYLISRINQQKGPFRNVTEESLKEEIRTLNSSEIVASQDDTLTTIEGPQEVESTKEDISTAREEILKQIRQATAESSMALDLVSLLLSNQSPATAQSTISPYLKAALPLGVLGGEVVQTPQLSDSEKRDEDMVSIGWRMQSLNKAADSLLDSASRLEVEIGRETTYWSQVLAVKEKRWPLSRLPREKHTLAVRYGFAEAYSDFRDRGLAALRRDANGNLGLDHGFTSKGHYQLRVRMLRQGKAIASTIMATSSSENESVEKEILNARDSMFDEELHHEIHREARNLVNQGVCCVDTSVLIPFEIDKQIEIDLVSTSDSALEVMSNDSSVVDNIATSLRILLSYAHRQSLRNRSQKPPPLRDSRVSRPLYAILKPVVEYLQHQSHVQSVHTFLGQLRKTLAVSGLDLTIETAKTSQSHAFASITNNKSSDSNVETLIKQLTSPLHSATTMRLPDSTTNVTIDIHTALHPPTRGTSSHITSKNIPPTSTLAQLPQSMQFSSLAPLESHINQLTTLSILHHLTSNFSTWRSFSPYSTSIMRNRLKSHDREMVSVVLEPGRLGLNWQRTGTLNDEANWTWDALALESGGKERSLIDVFKTL